MSTALNPMVTAGGEGDIVCFHIGMRVNRWLAVRAWTQAMMAMPAMLRELAEHPEWGLLGQRTLLGSQGPEVFQYWESLEKLVAYAQNADAVHRPKWTEFNRLQRGGNQAVGIWHETYLSHAESRESIYRNMPTFGLAAATSVVPIERHNRGARDRLKKAGVPV